MFDKGLIREIYKELLQFNSKNKQTKYWLKHESSMFLLFFKLEIKEKGVWEEITLRKPIYWFINMYKYLHYDLLIIKG